MPDNRRILDALRNIPDLQNPVKTHTTPTSTIGKPRGLNKSLPPEEDAELLAKAKTILDVFNQTPLGAIGDLTDPLSNVDTAGLPFLSYASKGLRNIGGKPFVTHGTPKLDKLEKFDPSKYNTSDILGWMTHFAENPEYSNVYAGKGFSSASGKGVIPAQIDAKNVLDLIDPNPDDLSQALAFVPKFERADLIRRFKKNRAIANAYKEIVRTNPQATPEYLESFRPKDYWHAQATSKPADEYAITKLAENIRLSPRATEEMPFDAIRYMDMNEKSWAVPHKTPIRSVFGPELTAKPVTESPIKAFRKDDLGGNLPILAKDRIRFNDPLAPVPNEEFVNTTPFLIGDTVQIGKYGQPIKITDKAKLKMVVDAYENGTSVNIASMLPESNPEDLGDEFGAAKDLYDSYNPYKNPVFGTKSFSPPIGIQNTIIQTEKGNKYSLAELAPHATTEKEFQVALDKIKEGKGGFEGWKVISTPIKPDIGQTKIMTQHGQIHTVSDLISNPNDYQALIDGVIKGDPILKGWKIVDSPTTKPSKNIASTITPLTEKWTPTGTLIKYNEQNYPTTPMGIKLLEKKIESDMAAGTISLADGEVLAKSLAKFKK